MTERSGWVTEKYVFVRLLHTDQEQVFLFRPTKLAWVPFRASLRTAVLQINYAPVAFYLQMVEVMGGSGVYWYLHHLSIMLP